MSSLDIISESDGPLGSIPYVPVPVPSIEEFDPHNNPITYLFPDASNMTFTMAQIDEFRGDQVFTSAIFAAQIGAAFVTLCVMLCITHLDKRKTLVFGLNAFNLLLVIARGILFVHYFVGPLARTYTTFSWDVSDVPMSEINASLVSSTLSLFLMVGTQISLLLQVRICYALNPRSKASVLGICGSVSIFATTAYLALGIYIIQLRDNPPDLKLTRWAMPTVNALVALSIVVYSGLFSWRMFQSVRNRRRMGFTGLGSLESLLISGCQCLVLPALFCIIENFVKFGGSASLAQACVALMLPISHLWATKVQTNSRLTISRIEKLQQKKSFGQRLSNYLTKSTRCFAECIRAILSAARIAWGRIPPVSRPKDPSKTITDDSRTLPTKNPVRVRESSTAGQSSVLSSWSKDSSGFGKDLEAAASI